MKPVECFHVGPQKAATTWVYQCLSEHPEVACPPSDTIHYFDIHYSKGRDWYAQFFESASAEQKLFDPTYTYIRSPWAPRRIAEENPDAKIALCLRNPVDRAFSHYWHEKKKRKIAFDFSEVLTNYDLFASWIEPGLYAEHIERYLEHFSREQILCLTFQTLKENSRQFLQRLFLFYGVSTDYAPSVLDETVNQAGERRTIANEVWRRIRARLQTIGRDDWVKAVEESDVLRPWVAEKTEYEQGVDAALRAELLTICEPEIQRLEDLLDLDLSVWRT